jgi:hypothetical protein
MPKDLRNRAIPADMRHNEVPYFHVGYPFEPFSGDYFDIRRQAMFALVGIPEVFDVDPQWDVLLNHGWRHWDTAVAIGRAGRHGRHHGLLSLLSVPLFINEFLAHEFDVEPSPTGRTMPEELPNFAHQVMH